MEKENWIEDVFNSTDGMVKVQPDDGLFSRIQHKIKAQNRVAIPWLWLAAASLAILISINIKMLFFKSDAKNEELKSVASFLSNSNQLY